jgi:hypothetical protein
VIGAASGYAAGSQPTTNTPAFIDNEHVVALLCQFAGGSQTSQSGTKYKRSGHV